MNTAIFAGAGASRGANRGGIALIACFGLLISTFGIMTLAKVPWQQAATCLSARSWPTAEATILSVSLREERSHAASELVLTVAYGYQAGGQFYEGNRAGLADRSGIDDRRLKTLYRKLLFAKVTGKAMPAFYDPADPASAFLGLSVAWKAGLLHAGLGLALILMGFAIVSSPLRGLRTPQPLL